MYWFFATPGWGQVLWLLSLLLVAMGGWLIVSHVFSLEPRERVLAGFALGLVCYLWLINWIGRVLPPFWAYFGAALLVALIGLASAYPFRERLLDPRDLKIGGWLVSGAALLWVFLRISKGTGLFDEYKNLALISTLGNGQIPVMATFGQPQLLLYHYGFHFLGAGMMQLGRFTPWSAFDLSKSLVWSLSLLLAGLVGMRTLRVSGAAALMAGAVALAGGTRYLLLLLPSDMLGIIQKHVTLRGIASGPLIPALSSILPMEASPRIGYPFAFLSGVNPAYVMAHGGEQTIEPMLLMLGLLLAQRSTRRLAILFFAILFSFWALASETSLVLIAAGWAIMLCIRYARQHRLFTDKDPLLLPTLGMLLSFPLILLQGGVVTALAQQLIQRFSPGGSGSSGASGFSLRWPPAILSGQIGAMPITDPWALTAGILEMGIAVIMLPWLTVRWWRREIDSWLLQWLIPIAWLGVLIPLFVSWSSDANISHISDFGLDVALVLLVIMLAGKTEAMPLRPTGPFHLAGSLALALAVVPGIVLLGVQLTAAQTTILSEHYGDAEARLLRRAWGTLPRSSKVLGFPGAGSILTGQLVGGVQSLPRIDRQIWEEMLVSPKLNILVENDFDFVFVSQRWWNDLSEKSQQEMRLPCVQTWARGEAFAGGNFAEVLDLRGCR